MAHLEPLRFVKIAMAREQLREAERLIRHLALDKHLKNTVDAWFRKLPSVMEGLPQTFEPDDQICYRAPDGSVVDGVIVATVTCHERFVVAPGDSRATKGEPIYMVCPSKIVRRGQPLPPDDKE
jgi:hypothetical protein